MTTPQAHREQRHPTPKQYAMVATFLFIVTIIEVAVIYIDALDRVVVPILIILSGIKFAGVVMFYMHLRFDSRLFTALFVGGLALAFAVFLGLLWMQGAFDAKPRAFARENAQPFEEHGGPGPTLAPGQTPAPGGEQPPADLVAQGQAVFTGKGCTACHTIFGIPGAVGQVGPELTHIGTEAATRKPPLSAQDYIAESIREPEAYVATGVPRAVPGIMTEGITAGLSDSEVQSLIAFLLAQK